MPTGPKGQKRPADVIGNAVRVMKIATGEIEEGAPIDDGKDPHAKAMGAKGGDARARAEAFLSPELYSRMYEQHKGNALPPPAAIERQMEQLGVSPKQKDRARQVFMKSATYAGFVDPGSGRFIKPGNGGAREEPELMKAARVMPYKDATAGSLPSDFD